MRLLGLVAQRAWPQWLQRRYDIEEEEAAQRGRSYHAAFAGHAVDEAASPSGVEDEAAEWSRKGIGDFLRARVHELGDVQDLLVTNAHLFAHALKARRPDLQFGDADRVLIGHAERELPRGFGGQAAILVGPRNWREAIEIEPCIA